MTVITNEELRGVLQRALVREAPVSLLPILEVFDQLSADAARFAAVRLIVCETDKAKQERMLAAFESFMNNNTPPDQVTPEQFDLLFDSVLVLIDKARNADS